MPSPPSVLRHPLRLPALGRRLTLALLAGLVATGACAGQFTVQPTRLELGAPQRSGALTLRNESPTPLSFRIQGLRWTQDADGQERYGEAPELVYFPRLLTLPPGEAAVIRVAIFAAIVAGAARVMPAGKIDSKRLDAEQHAAHGLAWLATYAATLRELASFALRLAAAPSSRME